MFCSVPTPARLRRHTPTSLAVVLSALCLASCSGSGPAPAAAAGGAGSAPAVPVVTATAIEKSMPVNLQAVGNAEAVSTVDVRAQVSGELQAIHFKEGDEVTAGQPLFTLDPRPFEVALKQAEAALVRDTAQAQNAEAQRARLQSLSERGLIAKSDYDAAAASAAALNAALKVHEAVIEEARLQLQRTKIAAPVSGRTGALLVHQGALIRANDASALVVIRQIAPIDVTFAVPARALGEIQAGLRQGGLPVEARAAGSTAPPAVGRITFIDNAADAASDTVRIKATFPNEDRRLWPGQFVEVSLRLAVEARAIVVPATAVQPGQQGTFVYVVTAEQTAEARPVTVSRTDRTDAVIAAGLKAGEVVVTDGQLRLTPGARVSVKPSEPLASGTR